MRTLLAHEWLAPIGGSENVFEELTLALPEARRICLWNDAPSRFHDVEETALARTSLRRRKSLALPAMRFTWGRVDLDEVDRVVTSSHAMAHHLAGRAVRRGQQGFAYIHSPARYLWSPEYDPRGASAVVRAAARPIRRIDLRGVDSRVNYAANSQFVRARIEASWGVDSTVIYPPVDTEAVRRDSRTEPEVPGLPDAFIFCASRLISYKRVDRAMAIGAHLQMPVVVAGDGPDRPRLEAYARELRASVHFVGRVDDRTLRSLYGAASLFVFLAVEDFGIMPVEAMAAGTPVLVNDRGGSAESVRLTGGGLSCDPDQSLDALAAVASSAMETPMAQPQRFVDMFSRANFRKEVTSWLATV